MLEAELVLCPWHRSTASDEAHSRVGKLTHSTELGSAKHSVRLEVGVDDDATLASGFVTDVLLRPSLLKGSLQLLPLCKQRLLQTSIGNLLPIIDTITLPILEVAEEEECFRLNVSKICLAIYTTYACQL